MAPVQRKRNARGHYETDLNATVEDSIVGKVVREEYEGFIERLKVRLSMLSATDLTDIETSNYKDDIGSVMGQYLGASMAKVAINFVKKLNPWNLFCKENYARKTSELKNQEMMGMSSAYLIFRRYQ